MRILEKKLGELIGEIIGQDPEEFDSSADREDIDGWDSLNHLRIITAAEREFSVSLSMEEIESVDSGNRLIEILRSYGATG